MKKDDDQPKGEGAGERCTTGRESRADGKDALWEMRGEAACEEGKGSKSARGKAKGKGNMKGRESIDDGRKLRRW